MYKNLLPYMAGYLTHQDKILFANCDVLFKDIAKYENEFFKEQQSKIQRQRENGFGQRGRRGGFQGGHRPQDPSRDPARDQSRGEQP